MVRKVGKRYLKGLGENMATLEVIHCVRSNLILLVYAHSKNPNCTGRSNGPKQTLEIFRKKKPLQTNVKHHHEKEGDRREEMQSCASQKEGSLLDFVAKRK